MKRAQKRQLTLETRRRDLILATLESIRKHGFINSTIKTISEESNLSRGLINHYFASKDELLFEAFRFLTDELDVVHRTIVKAAGPDPFDRLLAAAMTPFLREQPYREVWLHFWSAALINPVALAHHRDLWGRYRASITRRVSAAAEARGLAIDVPATTIMFTQLIDGLWVGWIMEQSYDLATCRRIMRDWLCGVFGEDPAKYPAEPPGGDLLPDTVLNGAGRRLPR